MVTFNKSQMVDLLDKMFSAKEGTNLIPIASVDGSMHIFAVFNKNYQDHTRTAISLDGDVIWTGSLLTNNCVYAYPVMRKPERYGFKYTVID